jgi:hypothetical protein
MGIGTKEIEIVLKRFFDTHQRGLAFRYETSIHSGFSYEGIDLYAYDREHNHYFREHVPPETMARLPSEGFGATVGKHVGALWDRVREHEATYLKGL